MKLILASASPRRAEILRDAGFLFETLAVQVDEDPWHNEPPAHLARRLAQAKAEAAAKRTLPPALIVGADTTVVIGSHMLGKPASREEASAMLRLLSGQRHEVITGIAMIRLPDGASRTEHEITRVSFAPLSEQEIQDYVASGEPLDKAGGYAIQGRAGRYVTRVEGCYFNIVGLPLARLYHMLRELGWSG